MYHLFLFLLFIIAIYLIYYGIKRLVYPDCDTPQSISGHQEEEEEESTDDSHPSVRLNEVLPDNEDISILRLQYFCIKDKGYNVSVWPKEQGFQGIDYIDFNIAGITHGEHVDEHLGEFVATLEPDPTNPYDANAIKIITDNGHRVGFVPRDTTSIIRDFTPLPCKCYCFIGNNNGIYFSDCYITKN